jgi:hypothetical protein
MYSPFEEMTWPQFISQPHLKKLSLQEQADMYNQYMFEISTYQQNWISYQNKGLPPSGNTTPTGSIPSIISYFNYAGFYNEDTFVNWTSYSASQAKCAFIDVSTAPSTVTGSTIYPTIAGQGVRSYTTPAIGVTLYDFYNPSIPYEPAGFNQTASVISGLYGDPNAAVYTLFQGVITNIQLLSSLPTCLPTVTTDIWATGQSSSLSSLVFFAPLSPSNAKCAYLDITNTPPSGTSPTYPVINGVVVKSFVPITVGTPIYEYNTQFPLTASTLQNGSNLFASSGNALVADYVYTISTSGSNKIVSAITPFSSLPTC